MTFQATLPRLASRATSDASSWLTNTFPSPNAMPRLVWPQQTGSSERGGRSGLNIHFCDPLRGSSANTCPCGEVTYRVLLTTIGCDSNDVPGFITVVWKVHAGVSVATLAGLI